MPIAKSRIGRIPSQHDHVMLAPNCRPDNGQDQLSRRSMIRRAALMAGAFAGLPGLGACRWNRMPVGDASSLTVVAESLPRGVDPHLVETVAERRLARLLFSSLLAPPSGQGIATAWERRAPDRWRFWLGRSVRSGDEDLA